MEDIKIIEAIIGELKKVNTDMLIALNAGRPDLGITFEESEAVWNKTTWHKIIMDHIRELELYHKMVSALLLHDGK